jgi:AcrR family transcriptional regulator
MALTFSGSRAIFTDRSVKIAIRSRKVRETRWEKVLESAARLFAEKGFAATSVREIAEAAGLTKAGLYYHIDEKGDLLRRLCEQSISEILERVRAAVAEAEGPVAKLASVIAEHAAYFIAHPHNLTVLNREMGHLAPGPRRDIMRLEREYLDLIRALVREGQGQAALKSGDDTVAAYALLSMLNGLDRWYDPGGAVPPRALVRQIEAIFFTGMARLPAGAIGREA